MLDRRSISGLREGSPGGSSRGASALDPRINGAKRAAAVAAASGKNPAATDGFAKGLRHA